MDFILLIIAGIVALSRIGQVLVSRHRAYTRDGAAEVVRQAAEVAAQHDRRLRRAGAGRGHDA
jgi:hypothetical protein